MAPIIEQPLLSLCIPIYNRLSYLERQLARMLEDKDLFVKQIQLIISDNCSEDDLESCCIRFQKQGLNLVYHRNVVNIGAECNFEWCYNHANAKYIWILGSDDIPKKGVVRKIVECLETGYYGLLHLSMTKMDQELTIYHNSDKMAVRMNYWVTFVSANILLLESLKKMNISKGNGSMIIHVPIILNACFFSPENAVLYLPQFFEEGTDGANNGGYNLFQVFVGNLFAIYESFVEKGLLSKGSYEKIKKIEFKDFLVSWIFSILILKKNRNFIRGNDWKILWKHYGCKPYAYYYLLKYLAESIFRKIYS